MAMFAGGDVPECEDRRHKKHVTETGGNCSASCPERVEHKLVEPLAIDPWDASAGHRERIGEWKSVMLGDPAAGGQIPEGVVVPNRGDGREEEQQKEAGRQEPVHRAPSIDAR